MFRIGKMETSIGSRVFNVLNGRQTMKKIFVYMASAALVFAASCNKIEEANTPVDTPAETELITVELNPQTKTSLEGMSTVWTEDDAVSVTANGEQIGTLTLVSGSTFEGTITAGLDGETVVTLNYPAGVTEVPATQEAKAGSFANGAALLEGTTTVADLRAKKGATLANKTALLSFSTPVAGDVAFTIGNATYTVEGCETDKTYYACVDPAKSGKLSYTVGIVLGGKEKANFAPVANEVYSLGALTLKENAIYSVVGDYSNDGWGTDTMMYETTQDNLFVVYGIKFSANGNFKIRKAGVWEDAYNFGSANTTTKTKNSAVGVFTHGSSADINVNADTYDIYFDRLAGKVYIMESGKPYTEATSQSTPSTTYSLIGSFTSWSTDINMTYSGDGIWTIVHNFKANDEWKIRETDNWNKTYTNVWVGWENKSEGNDGNLKMNSAGDFIVSYIQKNKNNKTDIITLLQK